MSGPVTDLPFVDEYRVMIDAPADAVWRALGASLPRGPVAGAFAARVLGTRPDRASGDPLVTGSTIPGFAIAEATPDTRLVLSGRHRFSEYALVFELDQQAGGIRLSARTLARFPGPHGRAYRALVIGSRGHRLLVRRWLDRVRRGAEAAG